MSNEISEYWSKEVNKKNFAKGFRFGLLIFSIPDQKKRFLNMPNGPKSANNIIHVVNMVSIRNPVEKLSLVKMVLKGAIDAGCQENIIFVNHY